MKRHKEFFQGCLRGGAICDALEWLIEFEKLNQIKNQTEKMVSKILG